MNPTFSTRVCGLVAAFRRIHVTRMADLGLSHPGLSVSAVEFQNWQNVQVGVLITPWAMNLVVLAQNDGDAESLRLGADRRQRWGFPSGEYELMGGAEDECGAFQFCPLFSPMNDFADQLAAEETARETMRLLFADASESDDSTEPTPLLTQQPQAADVPSAPIIPPLDTPLTRRGFLRQIVGERNA